VRSRLKGKVQKTRIGRKGNTSGLWGGGPGGVSSLGKCVSLKTRVKGSAQKSRVRNGVKKKRKNGGGGGGKKGGNNWMGL